MTFSNFSAEGDKAAESYKPTMEGIGQSNKVQQAFRNKGLFFHRAITTTRLNPMCGL